jgi:nucleotide-binding universal stress UspA family protein
MTSQRAQRPPGGSRPVPLIASTAAKTSDRPARITTETFGPPRLNWPIDDPWAGWPSRSQPADRGGSDPFRILLPYNGTAVARQALDVAANLSRGRSAVVWILYVRHWDIDRAGGRFCLETPDEAQLCARTAATELRRRAVAASAVVRDAPRERVPRAIAAEAERLDVSCIVLGAHARRALGSALLGSTSVGVARRATRPVILVKAPKRPRWTRSPWRWMRSVGGQARP